MWIFPGICECAEKEEAVIKSPVSRNKLQIDDLKKKAHLYASAGLQGIDF